MSTSLPVIPAQPDLQAYGLDALALFKRFSRASFKQAFGEDPPLFDPSRVAQNWFDSSVDTSDAESVVPYLHMVRDNDGKPVVKQMLVPVSAAALINLPDESTIYLPYVIAPTGATRTGPGDLRPQPLNALYFSTRDDANTLVAAVGGSGIREVPALGGGFGTTWPADEARREYEILFKGAWVNVGQMLKSKNGNGVGAPGHWDISGQEPHWVNDPSPLIDPSKVYKWRDMPIRPLLKNEVIRAELIGVQVIRTDKEVAAQQGSGSGSFTADDRWLLRAIALAVKA